MKVADKKRVDEWVTLTQAAKRVGVSVTKLSLMAKDKRFPTRRDPKDERKRLVNMADLYEIFGQSEE